MKKVSILLAAASLILGACGNPNEVKFTVTRTFDCDVLVVGGGPAGIGSAVCAARHGAKTILAERGGYLGGMATAGLVAPFMSSTTPDGNTMLIRGFYEELVNRMEAQGGAIHPLNAQIGSFSAYRDKGHHGLTTFDYECLKRTTEAFCTEAGVELLYHLLFVKADTKDGKITGAYFATKDGIWKITAKTYIDCTGDGDVAYSAGAPYVYGDGEGDIQASSLFFVVRGVDWKAMDAHNEACKKADDFEGQFYMREIIAARQAGEFPMWRQKIALFQNLDGTATVNMAQSDGVDGLDPKQITDAEVDGRIQADIIVKFLRKYVKGCENCELASTAEQLGIRETRRIVGEYTVTTEDAKNSVKYPDPVFCCANHMDIHRKGYVEYVARNTNDPYYFPYRALLPQKVDNLLCAGRCAAAERPVMAAIRVIPPCFAMGQAAGTAAALAVKEGVGIKQLDTDLLVKTLKADGVYLPE
jgi:hypothetical protein